jgi:hypothetical protein
MDGYDLLDTSFGYDLMMVGCYDCTYGRCFLSLFRPFFFDAIFAADITDSCLL